MDFTRYQPANSTSAAIRAVIIRVNADIPAQAQDETAAKATRDALLIDGDRKALETAEANLRVARDDAERMAAVSDQLARRLMTAERDEAVATVTAALTDLSTANERANAFWKKNGSKLRSMLDEASEIVVARHTATNRVREARLTAFERFPETGDQISAGIGGALIEDRVFEEWRAVMGNVNPSL